MNGTGLMTQSDENTRPMQPTAPPPRQRLLVITNGNYFANLALGYLLRRLAADCEARVIVTTGLRRPNQNRLAATWQLFRKWGPAYSAYKAMTYVLPAAYQALTGQPRTVSSTCRILAVPCEFVRNVNRKSVVREIQEYGPGIIVSFSCPYRIKAIVLEAATIGCINVHSSLLPAYAGVCTYIHVLANGEAKTGITVHEMVEDFDAGRILAQEAYSIQPKTTVFRLFHDLCVASGPLLADAVARGFRDGQLEGRDQDLDGRSYFGEPTSADIARLHANGFRLIRYADFELIRGRMPSTDGPMEGK
jgi:methionyl-tRNA formyltransferase